MTARKKSRSRASADESALCQFPFADGRQCRMFRHKTHPSLCVFHARQEQQLIELDCIGDELASYSGSFRTMSDINHVIGKLFKLVARNRLPMRNAELLAYLAQLLLYSQKNIRYEMNLVYNHDEFKRAVYATYVAASTPARQESSTTPETSSTPQTNSRQLEVQHAKN